jgi:diguanylate cyclase (GGDEF)-like protein
LGKVLVFSRKPEDREFLYEACRPLGLVYTAATAEKAQAILDVIPISIALVDAEAADTPPLRERLLKLPVILLAGRSEDRLKEAIRTWPSENFIEFIVISTTPLDSTRLARILRTAQEYARLKSDLRSMTGAKATADDRLKRVYGEIKNLSSSLFDGLAKELEKRVALKERYSRFRNLKQRFEDILRKLYSANDVGVLLDIVTDIKEIVGAGGISLYILEQNETLGRYLKPLVWDDAFLAHADFSHFMALLPSQDFASNVARTGEELDLADPGRDPRCSARYRDNLKTPLRNLLAFPLQNGQEIIGVIEIYNKVAEGNPTPGFNAEDRQILRGLSEHISLAMTKLNLIQYDALTGLLRPDPFFEKIIRKIETLSKRRQETGSSAMVMGDVDWFKAFNDRNGHEAGNRLLRDLGGVLRSSIRDEDFLCRYGGEEFLIFLTGVKTIEEATLLTERIRKAVESNRFEFEEFQPRQNLTMSFGVTLLPKDIPVLEPAAAKALFKKFAHEADLALAEAKGKKLAALRMDGRLLPKNRVCVYIREKASVMSKTTILRAGNEKVYMEKRKFERYGTTTLCIFRENGGHRVTTTINLSLGGAKISTDTPFPLARRVDLFLVLGAKANPFKGDVVYCQKASPTSAFYFTGFRFRELTAGDQKILEAYFLSLGNEAAATE